MNKITNWAEFLNLKDGYRLQNLNLLFKNSDFKVYLHGAHYQDDFS